MHRASYNFPIIPSTSEDITWDCGVEDGQDRFRKDLPARNQLYANFPESHAKKLAEQYLDDYANHGRHEALFNLVLADYQRSNRKMDFADNDDAIIKQAKELARKSLLAVAGLSYKDALPHLKDIAIYNGVNPPSEKSSIEGQYRRLISHLWWRRNLRKMYARNYERYAIEQGLINKENGNQIYVSDVSVIRYLQMLERNKQTLSEIKVRNAKGEELLLSEIAQHSMSNPYIRHAEMMNRLRGFETIALENNHCALFITLTCPSKFHSYSDKYRRKSPKEAQSHLQNVWARLRSALKRKNIPIYGCRIAEPHHDGCPHWHIVVFIEPGNKSKFIQLLKSYALEIDGNEPGAKKHRVKTEYIDYKKGDATSYVAKYVSKHIAGIGLDKDLHDIDIKKSLTRVSAWASTWGIRQFQFFGGPPITVWRELRRIRQAVPEPKMEKARLAVDKSDWPKFVKAMGGPFSKRSKQPIKLLRVWSDAPNLYNEPTGYLTLGVQTDIYTHCTRNQSLTFLYCKPLDVGQAAVVSEAGRPQERSSGGRCLLRPQQAGVPGSSGLY